MRKSKSFWYVASTHYKKEWEAKAQLNAQGFQANFPIMRGNGNIRGQRPTMPLFEGYVFIRETEHWSPILGTKGIKSLYLDGDTPSRIRDSELSVFFTSVDDHGCYVDPLKREVLRIGDLAAPASGRFAGIRGELNRFTSRSRVELLYWMMGKAITTNVPISDLR